MLKRAITYEDFNGETATETFYFNLSKPELVELEVDMEGGLGKHIERIAEAENNKELIALFKRVILISYGIKSDDGKRFVKSDELRAEFESHAAYTALFIELATDAKAAADFVNGIMPSDLVEAAKADQDKPTGPPEITKEANGLSG
jgi:hypothetical protein